MRRKMAATKPPTDSLSALFFQPGGALDEIRDGQSVVEIEHAEPAILDRVVGSNGDDMGIAGRKRLAVL